MRTKRKTAWWIQQNKPNPGGFAMLGKKHSEETKRKIGLKSKGRKPMFGKRHSEETKMKISNSLKGKFPGEKNPMWKGKEVGYSALHIWVERQLGKPKKCENCGEDNPKKRYEWSSKSREYKRDLKDWQRLCVPCHRNYDLNIIKKGVNENRNEIKI